MSSSSERLLFAAVPRVVEEVDVCGFDRQSWSGRSKSMHMAHNALIQSRPISTAQDLVIMSMMAGICHQSAKAHLRGTKTNVCAC